MYPKMICIQESDCYDFLKMKLIIKNEYSYSNVFEVFSYGAPQT